MKKCLNNMDEREAVRAEITWTTLLLLC
uniref:Uncharacterized protein n=1 Tax=Rhizophora mucronata TaxID=61149 RepID=A0A2P2IW36_RHIMU